MLWLFACGSLTTANHCNEWCDLAELVATPRIDGKNRSTVDDTLPIQLYSLYNELRVKIKQALVCRTGKQSPTVTIDMGFDYLLFKGGLQAVGIAKQTTNANTRYKLRCYKDLDPLLDQNWHYRGANENSDCAFVILWSVEYYIHKQRKIIDYHPPQSSEMCSIPTLYIEDAGYALKFCFTQGYGNRPKFGTEKDIFNISCSYKLKFMQVQP